MHKILVLFILSSFGLFSTCFAEEDRLSDSEHLRLKHHSYLVEKANVGDSQAIYELAVLNLNGAEGVPKRPGMAAGLLRQASELGHPAAQNLYATLLANGHGIAQNLTEAIRWWRASATHGNHWAEYNLGYAYSTGRGVSQNDSEAAKWFKLAADGGIEEAAAQLGFFYLMGRGVERNQEKASEYMRRARDLRNKR